VAGSDHEDDFPSQGKRPAYDRDHLWLDWKREDGLSPAKIRDRWNAKSKQEREGAAPCLPNAIGKGEDGRDVVKKALQRARNEEKP